MDLLCKVCDRKNVENESKYKTYIATLRKKDGESVYKKYNINNINLAELNRILKNYVSTHNKKFDIYFIYCEFKIQFDNNYTRNL